MYAHLGRVLEAVRSSFWFVPTVMAVAAGILSLVMVALDERGPYQWLGSIDFIYLTQPEGARSLLSTIAGSMMNVAGVVFSLTMVAMTLASQQFGPRLMGNFMRDRGNQIVLGAFVATFIYCLLILRTIHVSLDGEAFVPHLSVAVALVITLFTLAALIYFIHHIAASIQVQNVIGRVSRGLHNTITEGGIFPTNIGTDLGEAGAALAEGLPRDSATVRSEVAGYIRNIDGGGLLRVARNEGAIIEILHPPGSFIMAGDALARLYPGGSGTAVADNVRRCFSLGAGRTQSQDVGELFEQMLELSLRSLSIASSDPVTTIACLDRLGQSFIELGQLDPPGRFRGDGEGDLRLITPVFRPEEIPRRVLTALRTPLSRQLLAAVRALRILERVEEACMHGAIAEVVRSERQELLDTCREAMTAREYRTLLRDVLR